MIDIAAVAERQRKDLITCTVHARRNKSAKKYATFPMVIDWFWRRAFPVSLEAAAMSAARFSKERSQHFPLLLRALGTHE